MFSRFSVYLGTLGIRWSRVVVLGLAFLLPLLVGSQTSLAVSPEKSLQASTDWAIETIDSADDVGKFASLVLDSSNYPRISYFDDTNNDLIYAYADASGWHFETADTFLYGDISMSLDNNGYPHVSYYGSTYKGLRYANRDGAGWHNETVTSISIQYRIGKYSSLALDSSGFAHISYYKEYNYRGYLQYAYQDSSGWHIEEVESPEGSGRYPGQYTSIALDSQGYPHISYYHDSDRELKYAYMNPGGWHIETVDSNGSVGKYTSLALDSDGYPHISYFDSAKNNLKYAYQDASGWHVEVADSEGDVGSFTSLELDAANRPHISYRDFEKNDLKYAYRDSAGWHTVVVDSEGEVGEYTTLALDGNGAPHIAYYDRTNTALKYARFTGEPPTTTYPLFLPVAVNEQ